MQEQYDKIMEKFDSLAARPTWGVAALINLLTTLTVSLIVLLIKGG